MQAMFGSLSSQLEIPAVTTHYCSDAAEIRLVVKYCIMSFRSRFMCVATLGYLLFKIMQSNRKL